MNADQIKGRAKQVKGKAEEQAGKLLDNKKMKAKGSINKTLGKVQARFGDLKNDLSKK